MKIIIKDDYTIEKCNIDERIKYTREIQLDVPSNPEDIKILKTLMEKLEHKYFIQNYNYKKYENNHFHLFCWQSDDRSCVALTCNDEQTIEQIIHTMNKLLEDIKDFNNDLIEVWVKKNSISNLITDMEESRMYEYIPMSKRI